MSWASDSVFAHYLFRRLGPPHDGNLFLCRPLWVYFCSRLWSCLHSSRSVRRNNTVGYLITWASDSFFVLRQLLALLCYVSAYARENGLQGVSRVKLIRDANYKPEPTRSWLFDFIWILRNAKCGKTLRCNLRNVPQLKFRKIHLFKFPHSVFRIPQSTPSLP